VKITVVAIKGDMPFISAVYGECTVDILSRIEREFVQGEDSRLPDIDDEYLHEYDYEMHYTPDEVQTSDAYGEIFTLPGYWDGTLIAERKVEDNI
jgi:hypothetical protein